MTAEAIQEIECSRGSAALRPEDETRSSSDLTGIRILVVMPSIPVQGMERSNLQIFRMMRALGADVLFVTEQTYGHRMQQEIEAINCRWVSASFITKVEERLHLSRSPREMAVIVRAWLRANRAVKAASREFRPHVIYIPGLAALIYSLSTVWRAKQPVVFRLPNPPGLNHRGFKKIIGGWLWSQCVARVVDVFVCNSNYTLERLKNAGVRPRISRVIHNCLSDRRPPDVTDSPRAVPGRVNVVYLGRIRAEKGVDVLVDAAWRIVKERDDVDFYLAGEYKWMNPFADSLIAKVTASSLESRIKFTGQIDDVFGLLDQCQLHCCPSTSDGESFPNVVLEAKSRGIPSVVFPTSGLPEAVTHLVDGYICPDRSVNSLYEGLSYFLERPSEMEAAGVAALGSMARFSPEGTSRQWAELFKECWKGTPNAA